MSPYAPYVMALIIHNNHDKPILRNLELNTHESKRLQKKKHAHPSVPFGDDDEMEHDARDEGINLTSHNVQPSRSGGDKEGWGQSSISYFVSNWIFKSKTMHPTRNAKLCEGTKRRS